MHYTIPREQTADECVDAIVSEHPGYDPMHSARPFSIAPDVVRALYETTDSNRDYNLQRLIYAHEWARRANAFGFMTGAGERALMRDFDDNREVYTTTAYEVYEAELACLRRAA